MPNEYSIVIHDHISARMATARQAVDEARRNGSAAEEAYHRGYLEELTRLRSYLAEHIDLKDFPYY